MISQNFVSSIIFYGNPGIGKTALALLLANHLKINYDVFNAAIDKKSNLEQMIAKASKYKQYIIIVEEIHRMNKDKQDLLLQYLEHGNVIMFACTTENPFFVINPAIRSRANIVRLERIDEEDMFAGLKFLLSRHQIKLDITDQALNIVCKVANGDLRVAINILELAINLYQNETVNEAIINAMVFSSNLVNVHYGDEHYDLLSALQKSIRGSDVDASLHYFSRLLASGDYETLMWRMLVIAYEDIGLSNPTVAVHVKTAIDCFRQIGMPEGVIILGTVVFEMAISEKSNSASSAALNAYSDVKENGKAYPIPSHLRCGHYKSASKLNNVFDYKYPHDYPNSYVEQQYLPDKLKNNKYYFARLNSVYERRIYELYSQFKDQSKTKK